MARLTGCDGAPAADALAALSALAQPPRPHDEPTGDSPEPEAEPVQLNTGLLARLQRIAEQFPGHDIDLVSGYRPHARPRSRHRSGDALDLHVDGVDDLAVAEFARGLEGTGVGYYPNSTFVHIDVRAESAYWVDRSKPGQPPDYGPWPPAEASADGAEDEGEQLGSSDTSEPAAIDPELQALSVRALLVMNRALGRADASEPSPASAPADELL